MSQTNSALLYAGIDVAKLSLDLSLHGRRHHFKNHAAGHARICALLSSVEGPVHVVLEATGGYEAPVVRALHTAGLALSVIQPARVRAFAKAAGWAAKTDELDAELLARFGQAMHPVAAAAATATQEQLAALCSRRAQLIETRTAETNRAAHYTDKTLRRQSRQLLAVLERQIAQCDRAMAALIDTDAQLSGHAVRLQLVPGVGATTAATLLAHLPELGRLNDAQLVALAGLAPYNDDSGPRSGPRHIRGGRAPVRCALYMAALSAVRYDRLLREFYQRLLAAGKKPLVALTAAMRKLLVLLNRLLKNPSFQLLG
jgi:transposase